MKNNKLTQFLNRYQSEIALLMAWGMVLGFLCGRAILSASMFLFFLNAVWNIKASDCLRQKWWLWGLAWIGMYALSYFWSDDIPYWQERFQSKFGFVIIPLAFAVLKPFFEKHLRWFSFGLIVMIASGCIYSLSFYFADQQKILDGYFYARVFPTPAYKDHIRYSIFVAWTVIWCCFVFRSMQSQISKIIVVGSIIFFTAYLHILAARSGLLVLYSFGFLYFVYLILRKKFISAASIIVSCSALIITAYYTVPSFQKKIQYVGYTLEVYRSGNHTADFSDIGRVISYKLAAKIIREHPVFGVGSGDIRSEMKLKYEEFSPSTRPEQMIVPHNQIMEVTLAGGIVTLLIFLYWLSIPIRGIKTNRAGFYVFATWFSLLASMMVEPMLEVQFGVFVFLFCLLWIQKGAQTGNIIPVTGSS